MSSNWFINSNPLEKAYILAIKQSPQLAGAVADITNTISPSGTPTTLSTSATGSETGTSLTNKMNLEVYRRLRYQYSNIYVSTAAGIGTSVIGNTSNTIVSYISGVGDRMQSALKPVSSFMGSTIGNLTGVLKDPVGSALSLPSTLSSMMDSTNPALAAEYDAKHKQHNINKLSEIPKNVYGSIHHIVQAIDNVLAVPVGIITDIYFGAMEIMRQLNDLVKSIFEVLQTFFNTIIRSIAPGITELLTTLADFANQIAGIANTFSGLEKISTFATNIESYTNTFNGILSDPFTYAYSKYAPPQLTEGLYTLNNPQQLLSSLVPMPVTNFFGSISKITGFCFNGNMGYGLQSVLEAQREGVISGIMRNYATQFPILAPLYTGPSIQPISDFPNSTVIASVPNGPQYNVDRTTGQIVRIMRPEPVIKPKAT